MNRNELYDFVERYLEAQECAIVDKGPSHITTQLSIETDKDITGRPYYWMFVERTGAVPQPMTLSFVFDEDFDDPNVNGELIKFGCWRLHQIFQSAKKHGQFIRLYEDVSESSSTQGLMPWLCLNYCISFISDQKKDIFYPLGFNLITGEIMTQFDQALETFQLEPKIPDYHFTLRPIYSLKSAIERIETHINDFIAQQDQSWAHDANQRIDEEIELIDAFFSNQTEDIDEQAWKKRKEEIEAYRPRIEVNPVNVGLIYLQSHPAQKLQSGMAIPR